MGLRIAPGLELPIDTVTQSMAILARRGAGKTYAGSVLVEEVIKARVPVCVLDPTGAWWGLRSSVDGTKPGLPVVIFGGDHADVPLERKAGTLIANVVLEYPGAYIIDFSAFESRGAEIEFATHFLERLYRGKRRETGPLLLVVDEADTFAPQNPFGDERSNEASQKRTLGALESIVRRGRIKGLGDLLITQRAAVLNKNVLTQTEILIAMQNTSPQDRGAIDDWVKAYGTPEQRANVMGSMASLGMGEAWVWSPSFLKILKRVQIRPRKTFDSSRTPEVGESLPTVAFAKIDLNKLGIEIQATREQAKANDPRELQARIRQLEAELRQRPTEQVERVVEIEIEVPVSIFNPHIAAELRVDVARLQDVAKQAMDAADRLSTDIEHAAAFQAPIVPLTPPPPPRRAPTIINSQTSLQAFAAHEGNGEIKLRPTDRAVLTALAQYPDGRTQSQTALLSGYSSTSGGFFKSLADLRRYGYIEGTASLLRITDAGAAALGDWEPLPTGRALLDYWLGRLRPTERGVLGALVEVWPLAMTQTDVATRASYSPTSGGFFAALAKLRKLDLIEGSASALRASDDIAEHR